MSDEKERLFLHFVGPAETRTLDGRTGIETHTTHYDDRDEIVTAYPNGRVERRTKRRPTFLGSGPASR